MSAQKPKDGDGPLPPPEEAHEIFLAGDDDPLTREGAARVLQGSGALEALSPSVYADLVARIAALSTPRESTDDREAHEVGLP